MLGISDYLIRFFETLLFPQPRRRKDETDY